MFDLRSVVGNLLANALLGLMHVPALGSMSAWAVFASNARQHGDERRAEVFAFLSIFSAFPVLSMIALPFVARSMFHADWSPGIWYPFVWTFCFAVGVGGALYWLRVWVPRLDVLTNRLSKKSSLERNRRTDVREIAKFLPAANAGFDPLPFIRRADKTEHVFMGLDERRKPVWLPYDDLRIQHVLLTGRTRSGKGVAAQILIPQLLARGEYVVVLDPKIDAWMPSVFLDACKRLGLPYRFIDLRQSAPAQCNPFAGCDAETLENMLVGGFSLTEKGEAADFYRLADRKAARQCAAWLAANPGKTARDALAEIGETWVEDALAFHSYMQEMAELNAVNAKAGGIDIAEGEKTGGLLYVVGDMINPRILRMQRMILLRLLFLAKQRDPTRDQRTICVFADEFKTHISRPFIVSLGASAGWGLHTILAFQSIQDLKDAPADLDKDSVQGSVMENCAVQLSYAIKDPDTAEWLSRSTGTILVDDETRTIKKNIAQAETVDKERRVAMAERAFIDLNMFLNLPKGCGVLVRPGSLAQFTYTSSPRAERTSDAMRVTPAQASDAATGGGAIDVAAQKTRDDDAGAGSIDV